MCDKINDVRVFSASDFFRENESVYIHRSDEFSKYVGIMHKHEFIEIVYIVSGKAKHIVDGKTYEVQAGDISVINRMEEHCFYADEEFEDKFATFDLMFTPDFLHASLLDGEDFSTLSKSFLFYSLFPDENGYIKRLNLIKNCSFEFGAIFEKIYKEYKKRNTGYINLIRVYIAELIIKLFRKLESTESTILTTSQKDIVNSVIEYIKVNYDINIRMEDISEKLFFNKNYIGKIFKRETGMPVSEFVREIRLNEISRQLAETDKKVSDIAISCGYHDMKSFYTAFKKRTGLTPKEYRDKQRRA